jgi:hypothetical protein
MENSYFIYSSKEVFIEKLHICTWEFPGNSSLLEVGCEISNKSIDNSNNEIELRIYIPFLNKNTDVVDLYDKLKDSRNSKFIFNDNVKTIENLDGGNNLTGVIHHFTERQPLCILPINTNVYNNDENYLLRIKVTLPDLSKFDNKPNPYFRFYIKPDTNSITTKKTGIGKSTIIYDIKINEKRNIPDNLLKEIYSNSTLKLCEIKTCFCIHILPNNYNPTVLEINSLKSIRSLEIESFKRYLSDKRIKENELIVIFYKKLTYNTTNSYSFFSIFEKERIGAAQFALAIFINLICGLLIVLPTMRGETGYFEFHKLLLKLPTEIYIAIAIITIFIIYFIWPWFKKIKMIMRDN